MKQKFYNANEAQILIIDDNAMNLELLKETLESAGFIQITTLQDPLKLNSVLATQPFDLVLLDINMPVLDGFDVLSFIQQTLQNQTPPILMVTAQDDIDNRIRAFDAGACDYITKPFHRMELVRRVEIHLENWVLKKQLLEERAQLERRVKQRTEELEQTQLEIVKRLGRASEYRDNETGNHVNRVSLISQALAQEIGCDQDYCELIRLASPMHDIGKIGISDTILLKPGKLTAEEYQTMQRHVEIGASILDGSSVELMQMAYEIALTHHEKFDGSGYPNQLAGEAIPLSGRIVAVADVYDALSSARPYKTPWPIEKIIDFFKAEKGRHFDPSLVDALIAIQPKVKEISRQYAD